jgi:hypothetical protein
MFDSLFVAMVRVKVSDHSRDQPFLARTPAFTTKWFPQGSKFK